MKKLVLLGVFLCLLGGVSSAEAVVDRVVAVVNQEMITLSELEKRIEALHVGMTVKDPLEKKEKTREMRKEVLDRMIEEKLIDQEAAKKEIKISGKEIDVIVEDMKQRNQVDQEGFEKALAAEGLTLEAYRKEIEKQAQRQRLISWSVKVEQKPEEKELRDFYQEHFDYYRHNEVYRPAQILFIVPQGASPKQIKAIKNKCEMVLELIKKGKDFGEMALQYSEDPSKKDRGDLGYLRVGEFHPSFENEALRLKVGEMSGVVQTAYGFHIIKLLERKQLDPPTFEEIQDRVTADYYQSEMGKAVQDYIGSLRKKSVIEIKL